METPAVFETSNERADADEQIIVDTDNQHTAPEIGTKLIDNQSGFETPAHLNNIASGFYVRYKHLGDPADLEVAITNVEVEMKAITVSSPDRPLVQSNLSSYLGSRCPGDSSNDYRRAEGLGNLSNRYDARYQQLAGMDDLESAIPNAVAVVVASTVEGGHYAYTSTALNMLGTCLHARYLRTNDLSDLETAISSLNKGITLLSEGHNEPERIRFLNNLSTYLEARFRQLGEFDDLETAIKYSETVIDATPEGRPNHPGRFQGLSNRYHFRYLALGDVADMENALAHAKSAVAETPVDHPLLASRLTALSDRHRGRRERIANLEDLNLAISFAEAAQAVAPAGHPKMCPGLLSLSKALYARYERFGKLDDLQRALRHVEVALASATETYPFPVACLEILGVYLGARYQRVGGLKDLEAAVQYMEWVVKANPTYLEDAIKYAQEAVNTTPYDDPSLAGRLRNLSNLFETDLSNMDKHWTWKPPWNMIIHTPLDHPDLHHG
ncbi:hypothetical protein Q9L58_006409 [Maublancomyces gigas]|uniref:Uncharacterized protein n=1 Tax=Discina gigas TaxID=1032678 RepID=A0ABR3GFN8_9PEZI